MDYQEGLDLNNVNFNDGSVVIVRCIYYDESCPSDDIFACGDLRILGDSNSNGCKRMLITWSTYIINRKHFIEVI